MPFIELDEGYKIFYLDKGKGKNIVFIHGFLGCSWLFEAQIEIFSKTFRAIAIDHLGHGKSDKPESESYKIEDLANYLDKTLQKIIGDEKIILCGHSMGGMIALSYATNPTLSKRLEGLILMGTAPKLKNPGLVQYIEDLRAGTMSIKDRETKLIKEFVDRTIENEEYVGLRTMESIVNDYNVEDKLSDIIVPTLILTGDKDNFILPDESKLMNQKINNSKVVVFTPKIGHMIQYEATNDYNKTLEAFLGGF
ncbi:MAG: alpha/beta fold hydrolase [Promethearchaeota archaeon]